MSNANARVETWNGDVLFLDVTDLSIEDSPFYGGKKATLHGYIRESQSKQQHAGQNVSTYQAEKVVFNYPATVVYWSDGTKTVVKHKKGDEGYDRMTGLALCYMKKALGDDTKAFHRALKVAWNHDDENGAVTRLLRKHKNAICEHFFSIDGCCPIMGCPCDDCPYCGKQDCTEKLKQEYKRLKRRI